MKYLLKTVKICHTLDSMSLFYNLNSRVLDTDNGKEKANSGDRGMNLLPKLMNVVVCLKAYTESADPRDMESPPPFLTSDSVL